MTRRVSNPLLADQMTTAPPRQMLPARSTPSFADPSVGKFPKSTGKAAGDGKLTGKTHRPNRQDKGQQPAASRRKLPNSQKI